MLRSEQSVIGKYFSRWLRHSNASGRGSQTTIGAGDFRKEGAELSSVFFAGKRFDAAGNIDGEGPHGENGFGNIFGSEPTGKDDAVGLSKRAGLDPVRRDTRAAELTGAGGIEKEGGGGTVARKSCGRTPLLHAQRFDDGEFSGNFSDGLRSFVTMELSRRKTQSLREGDNRLRSPVDENTDGGNEGREFAEDVASREW